uniref:Peptidase A2 domain-containing protein n=1 Tax=Meloidogyne incognita TaxID=6306 RepID=A0A914L087_MELIC
MKAEDIQKLLEQQQNKFNQQQKELQEQQNQQLLIQQKQIAELLRKLGNMPNIESATSLQQEGSALYGKLHKLISEFHCDIPRAFTFETWYDKYKSYFEIEGATLSDEMKARLLIAKLGGPEYSKIAQKLLPRKLSDLKYGELLNELKEEFGDPRSKLLKRFDTLKLKCNEFENILQFGNLVNAECEKSEMNLTIEEMKILIFIVGLPDSAMDLKQNCIRMVESKAKKKEDCKFKELLEDCRGFLATKKEVKLLSEPVQEPTLQKSNIEIENKNRYYPPKRPYCSHCRKEGHWTSYCYFADKSNDGPYCILLDIEDNEVLKKQNWIVQKVKINETSLNMIVDTAAQISIISKETWSQLGEPKLEEVSYNGIAMGQSKFKIEGKFAAQIDCNDKKEELDCHVVEGKLNVIGLPWLQKLKLLKNIVNVPEFEKKRKKIVWNKQKPLPKPIVKQKLWKGKNVIVKNKNNRTNKIEWLKGEIVGKVGQMFRVQVYCLKSVILRKIEDIKEDHQHPKIESKKSYAVKRSDARLYNEGATPKKKKKIWSENSEDKMEAALMVR